MPPTSLLAGCSNFRDLGGHRTAEGMQVRHGALFRSGELSQLQQTDLELLREFGVRLVLDLRSEGERLRRPSRWPEGLATEHLCRGLLTDIRAGYGSLRDILVREPNATGARRMMLATYRLLPSRAVGGLSLLLQKAADGCTPVLIHCTAGKDRTGFICACLLLALGVPQTDVYADYLSSSEYIDLDQLALTTSDVISKQLNAPASREIVDVINSVDVEFLDTAFAAVDEEFGSISTYFEHCGIDADLLAKLRHRLLEPG